MHQKQTPTPEWLDQAVTYAKAHKYGIIKGADANAHSNLWGPEPKHNDPRGEKLEEFILKHALQIANKGVTPTFRNSTNHTSCIDITLTYGIAVHNWMVHDLKNNYSDHNTITFTLDKQKLKTNTNRHWDKCDWVKFSHDMARSKFTIPKTTTQPILDAKTKELYDIIYPILEQTLSTQTY